MDRGTAVSATTKAFYLPAGVKAAPQSLLCNTTRVPVHGSWRAFPNVGVYHARAGAHFLPHPPKPRASIRSLHKVQAPTHPFRAVSPHPTHQDLVVVFAFAHLEPPLGVTCHLRGSSGAAAVQPPNVTCCPRQGNAHKSYKARPARPAGPSRS